MQQLVRNDEVLKSHFLIDEIGSEGNDSRGRARPPLPRHALNPYQPRLDVQSSRPIFDAGTRKRVLLAKSTT